MNDEEVKDMELIDREAVIQALNETTEIRGYAYTVLMRALEEIPTKAVLRDCNGCFGASFGDCDKCERVKITE